MRWFRYAQPILPALDLSPPPLRGRTLHCLIGKLPRLLRGVFRVRLEPQGIGTKIDVVRPFEASASLANTDLRKERWFVEHGKNSLTDQMAEAVDGGLAVRPGQSNSMGVRVSDGSYDDVIEYLRHR